MIEIKIVCLFFMFSIFLLMLGVLFSNFKINLINLDISYKNKKKFKYKLNFEIYLFYFIKIIIFSCNDENIRFFNKKVKYNKIIEILKLDSIINKQIENYSEFKNISVNLERLDFKCKVGIGNGILTGYIVTILSIAISFFINKLAEKIDSKLHKFKVLPVYVDDLILELKLECIISIKMIHILYVIKKQKLRRKKQNGRTSNRRAYVSSNG